MSEQPETDSLPKRGRPSKKSAELVDEILNRIADGEPLAQICRDEHMPSWRAVYDWLSADADFSAGFARARAHGYDVIAADCLEIADDSSKDWRITEQGLRPDTEVVGRARLRVDTRLKLLAKWDPKRYGERIAQEITGADGGPVKTEATVTIAPDEAYMRLLG